MEAAIAITLKEANLGVLTAHPGIDAFEDIVWRQRFIFVANLEFIATEIGLSVEVTASLSNVKDVLLSCVYASTVTCYD